MAYFKFISMAFQRALSYRVEYFTGVLNAFLYIFIFTSVWSALIPAGGSVAGLSQADMVAYAVLSTLIKVSINRVDSVFANRVKTGEIAVDLMKPFMVPLMLFCDQVGSSLFHFFARAVPMLIFCLLVFDIALPVDGALLLRFVPVYLMAFLLFFSMFFLISTMAFFFVEVLPFWIFFFALITLTSGAIIPLDFFPEILRNGLLMTPFPYLYYFPTMILLGRDTLLAYPEVLARYAVMLAGMGFLGTAAYRAGLRKLTIAGG